MSKNIRGREGRSPYTTEADRVFLEHMKTAWASLYREGVIPPRYPVPSLIGPVTQGPTWNSLVLWPADADGQAVKFWELYPGRTIGETLGIL